MAGALHVLSGCAGEGPPPSVAAKPVLRSVPLPPNLVGLGDDALRRILGRPTLQRREGPGEIWQYTGEQCVLLVVLYRPPEGGRATVAQVNAVASDEAAMPAATGPSPSAREEATDRCLSTLARVQRSGIES